MASAPETLVSYTAPVSAADAEGKKGGAGGDDKAAASQLDEILTSILPPRTFAKGETKFLQYTSKTPATRLDVIKLQEKLDDKLMQRQARESGICAVREDLYTQCFDELIRQITINCPERGLLLLRVRDEIRMTIDAYKTLYDSSVTFGVRKQLEAEQGMAALEAQVAELQKTKKFLESEVMDLVHRVEVIEKRGSERRLSEQAQQRTEIEFLKYQSEHLESFLKTINAKAGGQ